MILLITGWFDEYDRYNIKTGRKNFLVSHGVDLVTDKNIVLPNEYPTAIGGVFDTTLNEWVIE